MNKLMMTAALFLMAAAPGAMAQAGRTAPNAVTPNTGVGNSIPQAPVGHRQPRRGEVPSEKNLNNPNDPISREDAELNRKLKSICRGC